MKKNVFSLKEQVDMHARRAAVLRALPAYLREDDSTFLKLWDVSLHIKCSEVFKKRINLVLKGTNCPGLNRAFGIQYNYLSHHFLVH